jgi:uncharacterized protein YcbX
VSRLAESDEMARPVAGRLAAIWRYPVMGMQGQELRRAELTLEGIVGDHVYVVRDEQTGRLLDPKSHAYAWGETSALPRLIDFGAELGRDGGEPALRLMFPDGGYRTGSADQLGEALSETLSRRVELVKYPRIVQSRVVAGRTLHLLSDSSLAAISATYPSGVFDVRRFRPNLFLECPGADGFVEEGWLGRPLTFGGGVTLRVEKPNIRCVVTTLSQGELGEDAGILRTIEQNNARKLGVMCTVTAGGSLSVGDAVSIGLSAPLA